MRTFIVIVSEDIMCGAIKNLLSSFGDHEHLFENAFLLNTNSSSIEIRDALKEIGDEDSCVYVGTLSRGSAWYNCIAKNSDIKQLYEDAEEDD